jgi:short/branched chain acyl-CoA dehydrogenase
MLLRSSRRLAARAQPRVLRSFSTQQAAVAEEGTILQPLTTLSEDEAMMREVANQFATNEVAPRASAMDEAGVIEPEVFTGLFEGGFMGVEIAEEYGGSGCTFTAANLVIEELARADPAVAVAVDIHNTIINNW